MVRIWSQPTPRWRSASRRHSTASGAGAPSRRSSTTKSLPAPCILLKRRPAGTAAALTGSNVAITVIAGVGVAGIVVVGVLGVGVGIFGIVHLLLRPFLVLRRGRRQQRALVAAGGQHEHGR